MNARVTSNNLKHYIGLSFALCIIILIASFLPFTIERSNAASLANAPTSTQAKQTLIPINFTLQEDGFLTLIIDNDKGDRVRNLISETWLAKGPNTVWWDGMDDLGHDADAAKHGLYQISAKFVQPGAYRIRGIFRKAIVPHYEFSMYSTGNPPWSTPDHVGGWLANHSPPKAALYLSANHSPSGKPCVLLGSYITEGPDGFIWVDLNGRKLGGKKWIGGVWTAAPFLASDLGSKADPNISAYVAAGWSADRTSGQIALRLNALIPSNGDFAVKQVLVQNLGVVPKATITKEITGFAIYNQLAIISLARRNQLAFVDARTGKLIGYAQVPSPHGVAFDVAGRLLVLSDKKLLRFKQPADDTILSKQQEIITKNLEAPTAIAIDKTGNFYITDRGDNNTVKVFDSNGNFIKNIGVSGPVQAGPYNPLHMNNPAGLTIDEQSHIWVAEEDALPKRVSVWDMDGKLINAFYGPGKYGGGGTIDSYTKNKFYYSHSSIGSMEFAIDWVNGTSRLTDVFYRSQDDGFKMSVKSSGPETPFYFNNKRYFTNAYSSNPTSGHSTAFLFIDQTGIAIPAVAMGNAADWDILKTEPFYSNWMKAAGVNKKRKINDAFFIWQDANADGNVQPDEVKFKQAKVAGLTVMPDLSFCVARMNDTSVQFIPKLLGKSDIPVYDINQGHVLATGVLRQASSGGNQVLTSSERWTVVTLGMKPFDLLTISGLKNGAQKWSYPDLWPGLHASHSAPIPDRAGELIGTTRLLGPMMEFKGTGVPPLWAINSNHGCVYLFTDDGLFVATLFNPMRVGKKWTMPVAKRNMQLDSVTLGEENFWPTISKTNDGKVYLVDGTRSAIVRLDGIETVRRMADILINVTKDELERCKTARLANEANRQQARGEQTAKVFINSKPPVVDGKLDDWGDKSWVDIDHRGIAAYFNSTSKPYGIKGAITVSGDKLYLAYQTGDVKLLQNTGEIPTAPFKTGGALDLMIGTDSKADLKRKNTVPGDMRLLVTIVNDKPYALLYKAVVPGTKDKDKIPFSSPDNTITFDAVEDISKYIEFAGSAGNYEISVPLNLLNLTPKSGERIKGDIGILRGDGGQTISRIYWNNKATGITADVPTEAILTPDLWGTFEFSR